MDLHFGSVGIIYLLEPYTSSVLKWAIKTPKLYFRDTGLAAYLTRWLTPETLAVGAMSGAFFETFVVSEILKSYSNSGIDYRYCVSYYRGKDKKKVLKDGKEVDAESEIELIIEENGILYPIEIKQGVKVTADARGVHDIGQDRRQKTWHWCGNLYVSPARCFARKCYTDSCLVFVMLKGCGINLTLLWD